MKLKKSTMESVSDEAKSAGGGAFISARLRNPADEIASRGDQSSDVVGGICAIFATVFMLAIAVMLYFNWDAIKAA